MTTDTHTFTVGVFPIGWKRERRFTAYTVLYSPQWRGCCEHIVTARNGREAKRLAIEEHRLFCITKSKARRAESDAERIA